jgi:hypothetical protein
MMVCTRPSTLGLTGESLIRLTTLRESPDPYTGLEFGVEQGVKRDTYGMEGRQADGWITTLQHPTRIPSLP